MPLYVGTTPAKAVYVGTTPASKVYLGGSLAWQAFTPGQITGLVVQLDAAQAGNLTVRWDDLSGAGNHGATVGTPVPFTVAGALNGLPIVRYALNGGRTRCTTTSAAMDYTLLYVGHIRTGAIGRVVGGIYQPVNILMGFNTANADTFYDRGVIWTDTVTWTQPSPWKLYEMDSTATGNVANVYVNGALKATRSAFAGYGLGGTYAISGYDPGNATATCNCEVAELLIYNRVLTGTERQQVETYLTSKYAL